MLKQLITIAILSSLSTVSLGQNIKITFKNEIKFPSQSYNRYQDAIVVNADSTSFTFGQMVVDVDRTSKEVRELLSAGLIYPSLFSYLPIAVKTQDSTYSENRKHTIKFVIDAFKEKSRNECYRTYSFLLFQEGFANPTEYIIEIYNPEESNNTSFRKFIDGANLTKLQKGSLYI